MYSFYTRKKQHSSAGPITPTMAQSSTAVNLTAFQAWDWIYWAVLLAGTPIPLTLLIMTTDDLIIASSGFNIELLGIIVFKLPIGSKYVFRRHIMPKFMILYITVHYIGHFLLQPPWPLVRRCGSVIKLTPTTHKTQSTGNVINHTWAETPVNSRWIDGFLYALRREWSRDEVPRVLRGTREWGDEVMACVTEWQTPTEREREWERKRERGEESEARSSPWEIFKSSGRDKSVRVATHSVCPLWFMEWDRNWLTERIDPPTHTHTHTHTHRPMS